MNSEMPKKPSPPAALGRPPVYREPRINTTLRLMRDDHAFLRDLGYLKGISMTVVLEQVIAEYRKSHQDELIALTARKSEQVAGHLKQAPAAARAARRA